MSSIRPALFGRKTTAVVLYRVCF